MIIFIYGPDTFRSRQKLKEFKKKFLVEVDQTGNSLIELDGEKINLEKINESIGPVSLFARKRMVVIENLFKNKGQEVFGQVLEYLKKIKNEDNIIIFWDEIEEKVKHPNYKKGLFDFLCAQKYSLHVKGLTNNEIINWTIKEIENQNGKINRFAAQTLVSLADGNSWQINNEINKLINYKKAQTEKNQLNIKDPSGVVQPEIINISKEDVELLVKGRVDENIFALTDAIGNKNKALAVKLYEEQLEAGLTDGYLLSMITRQFRILFQVRQALDMGMNSIKITNLLKLHSFVVQKSITQLRSFTLENIKQILEELINIDYKMKSGKGEVRIMLGLLIVKI